jgi:predicted MFS family arabinose efflux permease
VPIGLIALAVIGVAFHAHSVDQKPAIDYWGAILLGVALTATVLFTSFAGTTLGWASPAIVTLIGLALVSLIAFLVVETRAREPILPLFLFRNRNFTVTAFTGFIVGLAMFGAITFLPLYLQVVQGQSPMQSGLRLIPVMGALLVTSIVVGRLVSSTGRYKAFPIAGTALMTIGLYLLSRLGVDTPMWLVALDMVVLGVGLGSIMQVLVLAAQNSVAFRFVGVASATTTLFRAIGGSVGLAVFGSVFTVVLSAQMASRLPPEMLLPLGDLDPAAVDALPAAARVAFLASFTAALEPVFIIAAAGAALAFGLTWLVREVPLRTATRTESDVDEKPAVTRSAPVSASSGAPAARQR